MVAIVFIAVGLIAIAAAPFLFMPALVAGSWIFALRLRTSHPGYSRAWWCAGLAAGLLAAAIGATISVAPQLLVAGLLLLGFIAYAASVVLFGQAWSQGSDSPTAAWVITVSFGLVPVLGVALMAAFGRGIALADAGQSSWVIDTLFLAGLAGVPTFFLIGLIALSRMQTRRATSLAP
ncbi:hypothetical protein [Arthrobacter bussei]|uniref:Uncharacterized protein n=1 Tax=Arthrobacter bussei TaxID=2594179 RepID=A0A7X1NPN7_9MICC|nr:hypothetical protein [Arthrobacter bussei]MPY10709.1 hypothetical protein [Arthrobacter bussei]